MLPEDLYELVRRYRSNRLTLESASYVEASVRQDYLDPLFRLLGWDVGNRQGYPEQHKEVVVEPAAAVGQQKKTPDYVFRVGPLPKFFVEAKRPMVKLRTDKESAHQLRNYGWNASLPLCLLTNFAEFAVYDTTVRPKIQDAAAIARVRYFTFEEIDQHWDWLISTFGKGQVWRGSLEEFIRTKPSRRGTQAVSVLILDQIRHWREALARDLARHNPNLDTRDLNLAVQTILDRVLFLRICEDRDIEPFGSLRGLVKHKDIYGDLLVAFRQADQRYNSGLFHFNEEKGRASAPDLLTPSLTVSNGVLKDLIFDLYPPISPFNFRFIDVVVLGQVYEQFLGEIISLTVSRQVRVDLKPELKKAGGVVYTPSSVVNYILDRTLRPVLEGKRPDQIAGIDRSRIAHPLRVLDPASGSGSFLIAAYSYLLDWYLSAYLKDPKKYSKGRSPALRPTGEGSYQLTAAERKRILTDHIFGVDIDRQAVEVTKLSLLLKCLEGESEVTVNQQRSLLRERALPDLDTNIQCGNSLVDVGFAKFDPTVITDAQRQESINMFSWRHAFPTIMDGGGFDVVFGNPPYVVLQDHLRDDVLLEYLRATYEVASFKLDTYHLFMERSVRLTRKGGRFSMITPTNYLTNNSLVSLRRFLMDDSEIESITIVEESVFPRRVVDCAIIAARPGSPTATAVPVLQGQGGPHHQLTTTERELVDVTRARSDTNALFTGSASSEVAAALTRMDAAGIPLGSIAQVRFGKQLRDRRVFTTDVITIKADDIIPPGYAPCYTGSDIHRWRVTWSGLALLDSGDARKGGSWDPAVHSATNKLLTRQIGQAPVWAIDQVGRQTLNTIFMVVPHASDISEAFLLGVLNSSWTRAYWLSRFYDRRASFPKIKGSYLKLLPIPVRAASSIIDTVVGKTADLIKLTDMISSSSSDHHRHKQLSVAQLAAEHQLDEAVADAFELSEAERSAIRAELGLL